MQCPPRESHFVTVESVPGGSQNRFPVPAVSSVKRDHSESVTGTRADPSKEEHRVHRVRAGVVTLSRPGSLSDCWSRATALRRIDVELYSYDPGSVRPRRDARGRSMKGKTSADISA